VSSDKSRQDTFLDQDRTALKLAKIYNVSCDAQVSTMDFTLERTQQKVTIAPSTFTMYNVGTWCDIRESTLKNRANDPLQALAFVEAGDTVFGSWGRYCDPTQINQGITYGQQY